METTKSLSIDKFFLRAENIELAHAQGRRLTPVPLNFALPKGKLTALVGRNGSGKTSLLNAILGEPVKTKGAFFLNSEDTSLSELSLREIAHRIAFVPQEHPFPSDLRLLDYLKLAYLPKAGILGALPTDDAPELKAKLESFQLQMLAQRALGHLSTGERQKSFLARALLQKPELLLLDEPTNHLDPGATYAFWQKLLVERATHCLDVIVCTHDLLFVQAHAEWVVALQAGRIIFEGEKLDFFRQEMPQKIYGPCWAIAPLQQERV